MYRMFAFLLTCPLLAEPGAGPALEKRVIENELRQVRDFEEFTFEYRLAWTGYSDTGKKTAERTESGESYMSSRRNVDIPLIRNGKDLKSKDLEKARKAAATKLREDANAREKGLSREAAGDRVGPGMMVGGAKMSSVDVLRYCRLMEQPKSGGLMEMRFDACQSPWPEEKHYSHMRGSVFVDAESATVDSWKAWVTDGPSAGALLYEQTTQKAAGGIRVPALNYFNRNAAPHLFGSNRVEISYQWTKPQRFSVDASQTVEAAKE